MTAAAPAAGKAWRRIVFTGLVFISLVFGFDIGYLIEAVNLYQKYL
jgi:hypothetical protein